MDAIISYLEDQYKPLTIILYGSYADGSNNQNSDFDALLVVENGSRYHDVSIVNGIPLDVFIYPRQEVETYIDCNEFIQIFDGDVILDTNEIGYNLKTKIRDYMNGLPKKSAQDIQNEIEWCKKMLARAERGDAEGYYRWHWLLIDTLEIVYDILQQPYQGPKKGIRWLKENYSDIYEIYNIALKNMNFDALKRWVDCIVELQTGKKDCMI